MGAMRFLGFAVLACLALPVGLAILVGWILLAGVALVIAFARRELLKIWRA